MKTIKKAVIPVAGFGTRFLPATKSMPKEMLPIIDKPIIHYAVEEAVKSGITEIIFVTGRGKRALEDYFDHSYELEHNLEKAGKTELLKQIKDISDMADIVYIRQKQALGLGHAVLRARDLVGDEPFAVILPDDLITCEKPCIKQLAEVYERTGKSVLAAKETDWDKVSSYGIIDTDSKEKEFEIHGVVEKPAKEDAPSKLYIVGRYIFNPKVFDYLEQTKPGKNSEIQLTDAIEQLVQNEGVMGVKFDGEHHDAGEKLGFLKATVSYALKNEKLSNELKKYLKEIIK